MKKEKRLPLDIITLYGRGNKFAASERAMKVISKLIPEGLEWLPIDTDTGRYYISNIMQVLDCIDFERSELTYWPSGGIDRAPKLVFKKEVVANHHIFLIKDWQVRVFVSDEFKALIEKHGLEGARFISKAVH